MMAVAKSVPECPRVSKLYVENTQTDAEAEGRLLSMIIRIVMISERRKAIMVAGSPMYSDLLQIFLLFLDENCQKTDINI